MFLIAFQIRIISIVTAIRQYMKKVKKITIEIALDTTERHLIPQTLFLILVFIVFHTLTFFLLLLFSAIVSYYCHDLSLQVEANTRKGKT